ncbi:MAG: hypothetical protein Tsb0014_32920 [Pleurocapsa sp.]
MSDRVVFQEKLSYVGVNKKFQFPSLFDMGFLTANALTWTVKGDRQVLSLDDVVGVSLGEKDGIPCLIVNAYPLTSISKFSAQRQRLLKEYWFTCPNSEVRSQWQQAIHNTLQGYPVDAQIVPRRLKILLNPNSGKQQASEIYQEIRPLLERSYLEFSLVETFSAKDTKDYIANMDLTTTDGLVIIGGDGTVHDVLNALMSRQDRELAIKINIGVIPAGTGNGLCKTLLELSQEPYDPVSAAFLIAKNKQQSCDIATVEQNGKLNYSFLSLAWGFISDVDIESEKLRFLGTLRIDIYALMLILLLRSYRGRFSFIPHPDWKPLNCGAIAKQGKWHVIEDDFVLFWAMNTSWAAHDLNTAPHAKLDDGAMDVLIVRRGASRRQLLKAFLSCSQGKHISLPYVEYYQVMSFKLEPLTDKGILVVDGEPVDYAPIQMNIMPQLAKVS